MQQIFLLIVPTVDDRSHCATSIFGGWRHQVNELWRSVNIANKNVGILRPYSLLPRKVTAPSDSQIVKLLDWKEDSFDVGVFYLFFTTTRFDIAIEI
jgi:hypothetical protein